MKKNYSLCLVAIIFLLSVTNLSASEIFTKSVISKVANAISPTESFYTTITENPFQPTDSVDMSNSSLAPTMQLYTWSYPAVGYKISLAESGTVILWASSTTITTGNFAFILSDNPGITSYRYLISGNGTTGSLAAGTYYISLLTNNKYGKFKLNITSSAPITTALGSTNSDQIQLYSENGAIVLNGAIEKSEVRIYGINGQLVKSLYTSSQSERIEMPQKGLFIVKTNNLVRKIIVK